MTETEPKYNNVPLLKPCPFCGSTDLVPETWPAYKGKAVETVSCRGCGSSAGREIWQGVRHHEI